MEILYMVRYSDLVILSSINAAEWSYRQNGHDTAHCRNCAVKTEDILVYCGTAISGIM